MLRLFPSATMARYVGRMFLMRTLAVLVMLVLVLQTLDLLGESGKILAVEGNADADVWRYVGLRLPQIVARFLPFSVLLGTIITLATLNQNSEVIAMKAAGMSAHQVLGPLFLVSALVAGASFAFNERIVTRANAALSAWQKVEYAAVPVSSGTRTNVWVRDGDDLIHAERVEGTGAATRLIDVTLYDRAGGVLEAVVRADSARSAGDGWLMEGATRFYVRDNSTQPLGTVSMGRGVRPDQFTLADVDGEALSSAALRSAIDDLAAAGRPIEALRAQSWHKISGPLSAMLMPLLGAVAAFGLARSGRLFIRAIIGMALGFAYFVVDNFALAMGDLGAYPPLLAAWGPFLLFFLVGETVLMRTEE